MAKITIPNKITGDPHTAEEFNTFKESINALYPTNPETFDGAIDVSKNNIYPDYTEGEVVNLSLSETKVAGSVATVRIKGDLTGTIPESWTLWGDAISTNPLMYNVLTVLYISDVDIRVVNKTVLIPDEEAPSAPTDLAASNITATSVDLAWTASEDNIEVTGYSIYNQADELVMTAETNSATVSDLTPLSNYEFYVKAYDEAGNESLQSNTVAITTLEDSSTQILVDDFSGATVDTNKWLLPVGLEAAFDQSNGYLSLLTPGGALSKFEGKQYATAETDYYLEFDYRFRSESASYWEMGLSGTGEFVKLKRSDTNSMTISATNGPAVPVTINSAFVPDPEGTGPFNTIRIEKVGNTWTLSHNDVEIDTWDGIITVPLTFAIAKGYNDTPLDIDNVKLIQTS